LNKRTRVKLSPEPLDLQPLPGKGQLFAVANSKGWFVAAIRDGSSDICASISLLHLSLFDPPSLADLIFSPLVDLRLAFSNATPENAEKVFTPQRTLSFAPATPNIIAFASADTRLVVGLTQGPVLVFDTARLLTLGSDEIAPLHSFPSTTSSAPRQILPNPGDMPDLVAILRDGNGQPGSQLVEIVDVQGLDSVGGWRSGNSSDATPTSCKSFS
jgi:nucleoporin NUP159